ncbi:endonuclease/exonuclease/phosphatase family protein [Sphingobacterium paucimobilis]|nr:endonuclease/exonuclease/phosphatase family protein [Sphingobacterium paucimobilis]
MIIQECENPETSNHKPYKEWASNYLWIGKTKNKGLGIFAKNDIRITPLSWSNQYDDHTVDYFLPCRVGNEFNLLACWCHGNNSPTFGYIGQLWKYLQLNKNIENTLIVGDLNSNKIWDRWDRWWNHTDVLNILDKSGIVSMYHHLTGEEQGEETKKTFFLQRNPAKAYHIDYVFCPTDRIGTMASLQVLDFEDWKHLSDHVPVVFEN